MCQSQSPLHLTFLQVWRNLTITHARLLLPMVEAQEFTVHQSSLPPHKLVSHHAQMHDIVFPQYFYYSHTYLKI